MAATVSTSVWSKPGAWALDSEESEAELLHQQSEQKTSTYAAKTNGASASDFPSLAAAASTKTKKKKPQSMTLSEFAKPATYQKPAQALTHVDLTMLPTGPRERTAEELDRSRLGGGFRSYGMGRDNESSSSKWGGGGSSSRASDEMPRRQDRELAPSRADEVDDWGATKKSVSGNGFDRRERGERGERGGFFGSESRADESDNWGAKKSFVPSEGRRERRVVGFESSGGADSGNWLKKKEEEGGRKVGGGAFDSLRERRGGLDSNGGDSENWGKKRGEEGIGSGGVRPRLNLQPRTLPVRVDVSQQNGGGGATPPKPKGVSNPFGEARPREEVLKEKGKDWKEVDEKLGKRSLSFGSGSGSGSGRATTPDERSWRKAESADVRPSSADKVEGDLDHVEGDLDHVEGDLAEETQG
ncbi:hypothetical protein C3L33_20748, partial [Rhododendron williamsianum]